MNSRGVGRMLGLALAVMGAFAGNGCKPAAKPPAIGLHQAVLKDDLKSVEQHIAAKTSLATRDQNGWTPLHLAALRGNLAIARALVAAGADPNETGSMGKTPIDLAREQKRTEVIAFLQQSGQAASAPPKSGGRGLVDGGLGVSGVLDSQ